MLFFDEDSSSHSLVWVQGFLNMIDLVENAPQGSGSCLDAGETCTLTSECCPGDAPSELVSCTPDGDQERQCVTSTNAVPGFVVSPREVPATLLYACLTCSYLC